MCMLKYTHLTPEPPSHAKRGTCACQGYACYSRFVSRTAVKLCRSRGSGNETLLGGAVREGGDAEVVLFFFPHGAAVISGTKWRSLRATSILSGTSWLQLDAIFPTDATGSNAGALVDKPVQRFCLCLSQMLFLSIIQY